MSREFQHNSSTKSWVCLGPIQRGFGEFSGVDVVGGVEGNFQRLWGDPQAFLRLIGAHRFIQPRVIMGSNLNYLLNPLFIPYSRS